MLFEKYIQIKNLMRLFQIYEKPFVDERSVGSIRYEGSERLLMAMCELEDTGKYPISSKLSDLTKFSDENYEARLLNEYLTSIPRYNKKLTKQCLETLSYHSLHSDGLHRLPKHYMGDIYGNCDPDFNADYIIRDEVTSDFLDVNLQGFKVTVERDYALDEKTFIINGVIFEDLKFSEMINVITYARFVKQLNLQNTQAAFFFFNSERN
jgi:hypothetical protein